MSAAVHIALLRGINLGSKRRVSMPALRELLTGAGYEGVRTYVQSGNIVLGSPAPAADLAAALSALVSEHCGFSVPVVVRSGAQLARVVAEDPLADVVTEPRRYQVSFLSQSLSTTVRDRLEAAVTGDERMVIRGREIYAWHPDGVARSKLWNRLAGQGLGALATTRNWTTVLALLEMAAPAGT